MANETPPRTRPDNPVPAVPHVPLPPDVDPEVAAAEAETAKLRDSLKRVPGGETIGSRESTSIPGESKVDTSVGRKLRTEGVRNAPKEWSK